MKNPKAELLLEWLKRAPEGAALEVGCIREEREVVEDGFTPYLAKRCEAEGRPFFSVDTDPKSVDIANKVLGQHKLKQVVECHDGFQYIRENTRAYAFLFLDSHRHPSFTFDQYRAAELLPGAVLIVDDCQPIDGFEFGKAHFVKALFDHHEIPYEIKKTADNGEYQWYSLCAIFKDGKWVKENPSES